MLGTNYIDCSTQSINITKGEIPIEKNVIVIDESGNTVGVTYPKRARGLVKKGRAEYVNDLTIRLSALCPSEHSMEDNKIMNKLYFNAREWRLDMSCRDAKGERSFITDMEGNLSECYMIGDWENGHHSSLYTKQLLTLEKNQDYSFIFWLNGGENDRNNEICQFQVIFTDWSAEPNSYADPGSQRISKEEWDNRLIYKLNRSFIKPIKRYKGWELYEIPFRTENKEYTQLRFVAEAAYTTILPAKDKEYYADWEDVLDPLEEYRPQRHNIFFEDGWPMNNWYGTKRLMQQHGLNKEGSHTATASENFTGISMDFMLNIKQNLEEKLQNVRDRLQSVRDRIDEISEDDEDDEEKLECFEELEESLEESIDRWEDLAEVLEESIEKWEDAEDM